VGRGVEDGADPADAIAADWAPRAVARAAGRPVDLGGELAREAAPEGEDAALVADPGERAG
jgi:hypothetical protein